MKELQRIFVILKIYQLKTMIFKKILTHFIKLEEIPIGEIIKSLRKRLRNNKKIDERYLKLGLSKEAIKDINSEGYKVSEVINKTNIFDKSLLLNRQYAKFARNILAENNPELINDSKYIGKWEQNFILKDWALLLRWTQVLL